MIYLIGGVSKSGKSFIASKVMKEKDIPYFSTDFLLWSLGGDDGLFSYSDPDFHVSKILKPYILKIISFLIRNKTDYLIEGTHITPSLFMELKELYKDEIKACFLGYPTIDSEYKFEEILKFESNETNKWYKVLNDEAFKEFIRNKIEESKLIEDECKKNSLKFYNITNIKIQLDEIIDYLGIK